MFEPHTKENDDVDVLDRADRVLQRVGTNAEQEAHLVTCIKELQQAVRDLRKSLAAERQDLAQVDVEFMEVLEDAWQMDFRAQKFATKYGLQYAGDYDKAWEVILGAARKTVARVHTLEEENKKLRQVIEPVCVNVDYVAAEHKVAQAVGVSSEKRGGTKPAATTPKPNITPPLQQPRAQTLEQAQAKVSGMMQVMEKRRCERQSRPEILEVGRVWDTENGMYWEGRGWKFKPHSDTCGCGCRGEFCSEMHSGSLWCGYTFTELVRLSFQHNPVVGDSFWHAGDFYQIWPYPGEQRLAAWNRTQHVWAAQVPWNLTGEHLPVVGTVKSVPLNPAKATVSNISEHAVDELLRKLQFSTANALTSCCKAFGVPVHPALSSGFAWGEHLVQVAARAVKEFYDGAWICSYCDERTHSRAASHAHDEKCTKSPLVQQVRELTEQVQQYRNLVGGMVSACGLATDVGLPEFVRAALQELQQLRQRQQETDDQRATLQRAAGLLAALAGPFDEACTILQTVCNKSLQPSGTTVAKEVSVDVQAAMAEGATTLDEVVKQLEEWKEKAVEQAMFAHAAALKECCESIRMGKERYERAVQLAENAARDAARDKSAVSRTYGELPECVRLYIPAHEWDNKTISEQRDWLVHLCVKYRNASPKATPMWLELKSLLQDWFNAGLSKEGVCEKHGLKTDFDNSPYAVFSRQVLQILRSLEKEEAKS